MKKIICILLAVMLLSACSARTPESSGTDGAPILATDAAELDQLPLPGETVEFSFLSGAGGWRTVLTLHRDGTFTGWYLDSEMGDVGEGYPKGSVYVCDFSGKFRDIEKINGYSFAMTLADLKTEKPAGEEWIEEEIRYVASEPHGLNDPLGGQECTEFVFFLPDAPVDQLSEEFLSWWPYRYTQETDPRTTLSVCGILNVTAGTGFFAAE